MADTQLYWHTTLCRMKAVGPMGYWIVLVSSSATELAQRGCLGDRPNVGDTPCERCGWDWKPISWEEWWKTKK